jgi:hypothetical protein
MTVVWTVETDFSHQSGVLLVTEAFNRIQPRGLQRRVIAKEDSHRDRKQAGNRHDVGGELHFPVQSFAGDVGGAGRNRTNK